MKKTGWILNAVKVIKSETYLCRNIRLWKRRPLENKTGTGSFAAIDDRVLLIQPVMASNGPVPFGIAIADILSGAQLVQGIIAALIRRQKKV